MTSFLVQKPRNDLKRSRLGARRSVQLNVQCRLHLTPYGVCRIETGLLEFRCYRACRCRALRRVTSATSTGITIAQASNEGHMTIIMCLNLFALRAMVSKFKLSRCGCVSV